MMMRDRLLLLSELSCGLGLKPTEVAIHEVLKLCLTKIQDPEALVLRV